MSAEIFNSRAKDVHDRIADFFTDLDCQYHLIPLDAYSRPRIPALTPVGFAHYLTTCILAHPDEEFRRLDKIVADVQLFADTESQSQKLPRQLIRSQFPVKHDAKSRKILGAAFDDLIYDLGLTEPSTPRLPLAIMAPPLPSPLSANSDKQAPPPSIRHCAPLESYARERGYTLLASPETSKARSRYMPPGILKTITTGDQTGATSSTEDSRHSDYDHDSERARIHRIEKSQQDTYRPVPPTTTTMTSTSSTTPPSTSPRTSQIAGPLTMTTTMTRTPHPPRSSSYYHTTTGTTYRRAQSPPPSKAYRASAPDVSTTAYAKPVGYLPPPPATGGTAKRLSMYAGDRHHSGGGSSSSSSSTVRADPDTGRQLLDNSSHNSRRHSHSSSNSGSNNNGNGNSSKRPNTGEKHHSHSRHSHGHGYSHSHDSGSGGGGSSHHHHRRHSTVDDKNIDSNYNNNKNDNSNSNDNGGARRPTWEEALRFTSPSTSSPHHKSGGHRHHHRHHSGY